MILLKSIEIASKWFSTFLLPKCQMVLFQIERLQYIWRHFTCVWIRVQLKQLKIYYFKSYFSHSTLLKRVDSIEFNGILLWNENGLVCARKLKLKQDIILHHFMCNCYTITIYSWRIFCLKKQTNFLKLTSKCDSILFIVE